MGVVTRVGKLQELLAPVVAAMDCELWGIEISSGAGHSTLRVYIDKPEGVQLHDCARVSRQVSSVLDVEAPINSSYTLEVSSPGVDRPLYTLEQFARYIGELVSLRLKTPFDGRRKFKGRLVGVEDGEVVLACEEDEFLFPLETIDKANIVPQFGLETQEADR